MARPECREDMGRRIFFFRHVALAGVEIRSSGLRVQQTSRRLRRPTETAAFEHPAGNWKRVFEEFSIFRQGSIL